ncbi:MAG: hypothetical protein AAF754_17145 [Pseudomonadota bacterium]
MPPISRSNMYLGILCIVFAALVAFVWIPLDVETGLIEKVRRQTNIGDALAPTVAAFFVGLGGVLLLIFERNDTNQPKLVAANVRFISSQIGILVFGFLIMLYAGPLAAYLLHDGGEYRLLRDSAPWKYVGYFLGGILIVSGLISHVEGRFSGRSALVSICVVVVLIVIYDLPFEDLLLPPNGDV